jgi:flagellar protein FliJ
MTSIRTLNKVVELAEKRRDEALGQLAQLRRERQMANDQLEQLQAYAQEAQQRWTVRSGAGVDPALLHHHRQFMQKIDHAIEFQHGVLKNFDDLLEAGQSRVHASERDVAGLSKYTLKKQEALMQKVQRQDQKATDEMALTIHLRQSLARAQAQTQGARS